MERPRVLRAAQLDLWHLYNGLADVATVQEVCLAQVQFLRSWGFIVAYDEMMKVSDNTSGEPCEGDSKGQAVISRHPVFDPSPAINVSLQQPLIDRGFNGGKQFRLTCLSIRKPDFRTADTNFDRKFLTVCTTHLWSGGNNISPEENQEVRWSQANIINKTIAPHFAYHKWVLAGDFNSDPKSDAIDVLHRVKRDSGPNGSALINTNALWWEVDQSHTNSESPECAKPGYTSSSLCRAGRQTLRPDGSLKNNGEPDIRKYDYMFGSYIGMDPHTGGINAFRFGQTYNVPTQSVEHAYGLRGNFAWNDV